MLIQQTWWEHLCFSISLWHKPYCFTLGRRVMLKNHSADVGDPTFRRSHSGWPTNIWGPRESVTALWSVHGGQPAIYWCVDRANNLISWKSLCSCFGQSFFLFSSFVLKHHWKQRAYIAAATLLSQWNHFVPWRTICRARSNSCWRCKSSSCSVLGVNDDTLRLALMIMMINM